MAADWNSRMMQLAELVATWSKDPSRQVGAVVFNRETHSVLAQGYNGFARGADDSILTTCDRPTRIARTCHAESNSLFAAARYGIAVEGSAIATTLYPCASCALAIIQAGIYQVITYEPDWIKDTYSADFTVTREMLRLADVEVCFLPKKEAK